MWSQQGNHEAAYRYWGDVQNHHKKKTTMNEQIKIELSFTMEEMENFLLYNYPTNYHWKDRVKKDIMVYGDNIVVEDIKEEFVKCFKETLLSQRLNSRPSIYK
jgi:hypothetical protein